MIPRVIRRAVPDAAHRLDDVLVFGPELGAETSHVHVDRPGSPVEVVPPHFPEQCGARKHPPGPGGEEPQQLELLVRQIEGTAGRGYPIRIGIDRERTEPDDGPVAGAHASTEHRQPNPKLRM